MKHVCIVGGGGELAQHVIQHYLDARCFVTAVCRDREPEPRKNLQVVKAFQTNGAVDLLVTMTGSVSNSKLTNMAYFDWDEVFGSTLKAPARALAEVKLADNANVVVVGSIVGSTGGYGCANYAAAKAGLLGLVRAAANEFAGRDICVNLLELGYCNAGMGKRLDEKVKERVFSSIPLRRFCEPHEVVEAIDYLGKVRYMTGAVMNLSGGLR